MAEEREGERERKGEEKGPFFEGEGLHQASIISD